DTRNSGTGTTRDTYASASVNGGATFLPNVRVSAQLSNPLANPTFDSGDLDLMTFANGVFYRSWSDNSNSTGDNPAGAGSTFDIYTAAVRLVDQDQFELNNSLGTAAVLGSLPKITLNDVNLTPAGDVDFYKYSPEDTGKVIINAFYPTDTPVALN